MDCSFDEILRKVYELEGLVMVAQSDESKRDIIAAMLGKKIDEIAAMLRPSPAEVPQPAAEVQETPQEEDAYDPEPQEEPEEDETTAPGPVTQEEPEEDETTAPGPVPQQEPTGVEPEEEARSVADMPQPQDDDEEIEVVAEIEPEPNGEQPVTLDTVLQRNLSQDLRKAFTLNDMYRFRRELFSNNNHDFQDALNTVEAMRSYAEAEEYFYEVLGWDSESEDVADFMAIIRNHFGA